MASILVVEDHSALRDALAIGLGTQGHHVVTCPRGDAAIRTLETQSFDVVVTDLRLPGADGLQVLEATKACQPRTAVILMTAHGTMESVVQALRLGALDFIEKPFDIEEMGARVEKALEQGNLANRVRVLQEDLLAPYRPENIVGESSSLQAALDRVRKVAHARANVLITGETGTGKELVAGALHALSPRRQGEFVAVNCAAIPDTLLESELFGHERGAFTGAARRRLGRFEKANRGTLFLDEIGDMSLATQAKILRVLQDGRIERLGGEESVTVDVRVVAATHRDLEAEVRAGRFREDLYYRLNVVSIHLPPLRERGDDVVLLARHFAVEFCADLKRAPLGFTPEALAVLREHRWPGNVRELRNAVERAVLLTEAEVIGPADLGLGTPRPRSAPEPQAQDTFRFSLPDQGVPLKEAERQILLTALERTGWVQKEAARLLGITKRAMHYKVELHGITHPSWTKNRPRPEEDG
ncbi:MAG: sigma-54-dependent Fis family transcriptional regulator [Deltaproteobacteria bacterium]|nr:sigma-54-dependent Fis family transcriptional regulator [Deltaproteobacteria bacterium]